MTKQKTRPRRYRGTKAKRHFSKDRTIHLLPDVLVTLGVAEPALNAGIDWHYYPDKGLAGNLQYYTDGVIGGYTNSGNLKSAAELIIGGYVAKWIGKKTGLSQVGTKKVKIL